MDPSATSSSGAGIAMQADDGPPSPPGADWALLWEDGFSSGLDLSKWDVQTGDGSQYGLCGWGNNELAVYTGDRQNLRVEGGRLVITARREAGGDRGQRITSARIRTFGRFQVAPCAEYPTVKIEARIRLPSGTGLWPAFWMLPSEGATLTCSGRGRYGIWPASGEIDIMEAVNDASQVTASLHYGGEGAHAKTWGSTPLQPSGKQGNPSGEPCERSSEPCEPCGEPCGEPGGEPSSEPGGEPGFHVFGLVWSRTRIDWLLDGQRYFTARSRSASPGGWYSDGPGSGPDSPFGGGLPFHLLLNLAVGGDMPGVPAEAAWETLEEPKQMVVDYVRVWGERAGAHPAA